MYSRKNAGHVLPPGYGGTAFSPQGFEPTARGRETGTYNENPSGAGIPGGRTPGDRTSGDRTPRVLFSSGRRGADGTRSIPVPPVSLDLRPDAWQDPARFSDGRGAGAVRTPKGADAPMADAPLGQNGSETGAKTEAKSVEAGAGTPSPTGFATVNKNMAALRDGMGFLMGLLRGGSASGQGQEPKGQTVPAAGMGQTGQTIPSGRSFSAGYTPPKFTASPSPASPDGAEDGISVSAGADLLKQEEPAMAGAETAAVRAETAQATGQTATGSEIRQETQTGTQTEAEALPTAEPAAGGEERAEPERPPFTDPLVEDFYRRHRDSLPAAPVSRATAPVSRATAPVSQTTAPEESKAVPSGRDGREHGGSPGAGSLGSNGSNSNLRDIFDAIARHTLSEEERMLLILGLLWDVSL